MSVHGVCCWAERVVQARLCFFCLLAVHLLLPMLVLILMLKLRIILFVFSRSKGIGWPWLRDKVGC